MIDSELTALRCTHNSEVISMDKTNKETENLKRKPILTALCVYGVHST